jgi:hypothetical protein
MKSDAEILMKNESITEDYRANLQERFHDGTIMELGNLTRYGSKGDTELLGKNFKSRMSVGEIRSANNAATR